MYARPRPRSHSRRVFARRLRGRHKECVRPLHVYVHFPWCLEKCPYCDFVLFKTSASAIDHDGYADAVIRELAARASAFERDHRLSTIFIGGGTPSLWKPQSIARVIAAIRAALPSAGESEQGEGEPMPIEVSAECNPSSLDDATTRALVDAGVTRLSIGVQSFDDAQLRHLGRDHDAACAVASVRAAVECGARVSADLIFGLPAQPATEAARDALALVDLGVEHVSAYALTLEPNTRFFELARRGRLPIAEEDATCDAFLAIEEALEGRGLRHYEVSNYARPNAESRHNLGYWRGAPYLGLGCAAYGFARFDGSAVRYRNAANPARYVDGTRAMVAGPPNLDDGVTDTVEPLDAETLLRERIMLGLRLMDGIDLDRAGEELGLAKAAVWTDSRRRALDRLVREGGVAIEGGRLRIPSRRRLGTDGIAARLF